MEDIEVTICWLITIRVLNIIWGKGKGGSKGIYYGTATTRDTGRNVDVFKGKGKIPNTQRSGGAGETQTTTTTETATTGGTTTHRRRTKIIRETTKHVVNKNQKITLGKRTTLNGVTSVNKNIMYKNWISNNPMLTILLVGITFSVTLVASQSLTEKNKYFTIFDSVGEMASGMAYVHVAIPLNLSTFETQAAILEDYLFKLSRVVDSDNAEKNNFLQNVWEIANFAQVKLERLKNRMLHLDQILPFDGDLTQQRQKRTLFDTLKNDEIINYKNYLTNYTINPIELKDIVTNQNILKHKHDQELQIQLTKLKHEHEIFIKNAQINNKHRFKRQTPITTTRTAEYSLTAGLTGVIGKFNYTYDHTSQYQKQIAKEFNLLERQQFRITQIRSQITKETDEMNTKLEQLTNQAWTPSMDKIIGRHNFDMIHEDIKAFQHHLSKTFPEHLYNDRDHRTANEHTLQDNTNNENNTIQSNQIPVFIHRLIRNKRSFEINDKNMFIDFNSNLTIQITEQYRQLQMDINELIIQTIADLKENINTSKRLKGYTKLKNEGTKT